MNPRSPGDDSVSGGQGQPASASAAAPSVAGGQDFEGWLDRPGKADAMVQAELAWWRSTAALLRSEPRPPRALEDQGLDMLLERIASESRQAVRRAPVPPPAMAWWQRLGRAGAQLLAAPPRAVLAGLLLLVLAQGALLLWLPSAGGRIEALGSAPAVTPSAPTAVVLTVAFRPDAPESAIRQALQQAQAEIVAGPSALGLYRVAVPAERADAARLQLQQATAVVESVQR